MPDLFVFNSSVYFRDDYGFFVLHYPRRGSSSLYVIKPHEYFEAYTTKKNEEAKQWLKSQEIAN